MQVSYEPEGHQSSSHCAVYPSTFVLRSCQAKKNQEKQYYFRWVVYFAIMFSQAEGGVKTTLKSSEASTETSNRTLHCWSMLSAADLRWWL